MAINSDVVGVANWVFRSRQLCRGELNGEPDYYEAPTFYKVGYEVSPDNADELRVDNERIKLAETIVKS